MSVIDKFIEFVKKVFLFIAHAAEKTVDFIKKRRAISKAKRKARDEKRGYHIYWGKAIVRAMSLTLHFIIRMLSYLVNIVLTILVVCILTGMIVGVVFAIYLKSNVDPVLDVDVLKTENGTTMFYYLDENGTAVEIENERIHGGENKIWVSIDEIPDKVIEAFVAIEDHRFWDHQGVDWYRTLGAVQNFFMPSGSTFGGSTITQQLVKNLTHDDDYSIQRKVQEIFRALYLERQLSEKEILELYLNSIYLSQGCTGIKTAAEKYFGKDVSELTLSEGAALASIIKYPTKYDPIQNPEYNLDRRNTVLKTMLLYGKITEEEFNEAWDEPLVFATEDEDEEQETTAHVSSDYVDAAIEDIIADLMKEKGVTREIASNLLFSGGYSVYLAMDANVQKVMEECYLDDATFPTEKFIIPPQSAMVICDPYTGDILGIAGRRGEKTQSRIWNYATQARRSPGSSIKPLSAYGPALELGLITWGTVFDDAPVTFTSNNTTWPQNVNKTYTGLENVNYAVTVSLNTVAVRVLQLVTVERSYDFLLKLGITNLEESYTTSSGTALTDLGLAPLALGATTLGLTVREMASAYTTFTNGGVHNKSRTYYKVLDSSGNIVLDNDVESTVVFSEGTCAVMTKMMQNVVSRYNRYLTIDEYTAVAGKTGTSMYDYDRWFCGFTPYYVGAVWYGFDEPTVLPSYSVNPGMFIFDKVMTKVHQKMYDEAKANHYTLKTEFESTANIVTARICKDSGQLYNPQTCGKDPRGDRSETGYFVNGTQPTTYCKRHILVDYCTDTRCVACEYCPNTRQYALVLETERAFPWQVYVTDAQYMYRPLGGAQPYLSNTLPFYYYTVPGNKRVGLTYRANPAFNTYCSKHYLNPPVNPTETNDGTSAETGGAETSG